MNHSFEIIYHPDVAQKDLPCISRAAQLKIRKAIETKLSRFPLEFGEPLKRTLKGYWKLRVGDYRVIYKMTEQTIVVFRVGHRREVYEN